MERKTCAKCTCNLVVSEFYPDTKSSTGYSSYCKGCIREGRNKVGPHVWVNEQLVKWSR